MIVIDPKPEASISGTITGRSGSAYLVTTASGRTIRAESAEIWIVGMQVTVIAGQIVSRSGRNQPSKIYEV